MAETDTKATNHLAHEIEGHVIAWVLAHEIAHHLAENVNVKAPTLAKAREWELNADIKAFEILNRSGFSLYLLSRYMRVMEQLERIKLRTGTGNPEALSSHPHWSTRSRELQQYMSSYPPVVHRWAVYTWFPYAPGLLPVTEATYLLPGNNQDHLALMAMGESSTMVAVDRQPDNSAILYIRDGATIYQEQILDLSRHVTTIRIATPDGGYVDHLCFSGSFAGTALSDSSGFISKTSAYSPVERVHEALLTASISSSKREEAEQLLADRAEIIHDHILDFFRGGLTFEQFQIHVQKTSAQFELRLRATLGQHQFDRINQLLVGDIAAMIGGYNRIITQ